jgi:hypothetical protein
MPHDKSKQRFAPLLTPVRHDPRAVLRSLVHRRFIARDVRWGLGRSLFYGLALSVWAALAWPGWGEHPTYNVTLVTVVAMYLGISLTAGVVLGLLRPLTRTALGSLIVGSIIGTIGMLVIGRVGGAPLSPGLIVFAIVLGVVTGYQWGFQSWAESDVRPDDPEPPQN